jgi:hypothetical protein
MKNRNTRFIVWCVAVVLCGAATTVMGKIPVTDTELEHARGFGTCGNQCIGQGGGFCNDPFPWPCNADCGSASGYSGYVGTPAKHDALDASQGYSVLKACTPCVVWQFAYCWLVPCSMNPGNCPAGQQYYCSLLPYGESHASGSYNCCDSCS